MTKKKNTPAREIPQDVLSIPGFNGRYGIGKDTSVYNLIFKRKLISTRAKIGYVHINLLIGGVFKTQYIHRLMMITFCPHENSDNLEVNHIDGDKSNNSLDNLEWMTHQENIIHARRVLKSWGNKLRVRKQKVPKEFTGRVSRLTEKDRQYAHKLREEGMTYKDIGDILGVSLTVAYRIFYPQYERQFFSRSEEEGGE